MCRYQLSVDWQGYLYDCDFNQMLGLPLTRTTGKGGRSERGIAHTEKLHISNVSLAELNSKEIIVAGHCYACTAGQGSSCGGALS